MLCNLSAADNKIGRITRIAFKNLCKYDRSGAAMSRGIVHLKQVTL